MDFMSFMEAMGAGNIPVFAAFFIGLMMAASPCPLATNIAAIAYISRRLDRGKKTFLVGLAYALGRTLTYVTLASLIVWFGLNIQVVSLTLQRYGEKLLGPLLIVIGVVMLDLFKISLFGESRRLNEFKEKLSEKGLFGSFLLGIVFALAFCPFSAVLFFGMLIPLAIKAGDGLVIPAVFSIATSLPVILFSVLLARGISTVGTVVNKVQVFEKWARLSAGVIFIFVGAYYALSTTLGWLR